MTGRLSTITTFTARLKGIREGSVCRYRLLDCPFESEGTTRLPIRDRTHEAGRVSSVSGRPRTGALPEKRQLPRKAMQEELAPAWRSEAPRFPTLSLTAEAILHVYLYSIAMK